MTSVEACYGCSFQLDYDARYWVDQVTTYVAATVVTIIDNSTNVTATSTIRNPTAFPLGAFGDSEVLCGNGTTYLITSEGLGTQQTL